jgi:exopolysaccharide biosynthesis protein
MLRASCFVGAILITCIGASAFAADAPPAVAHPYPAVASIYEQRTNPPQKIYVAAINLSGPNVQVEVSRGGPDPDGDGKWQTTLMQPTKIADREGFDVVINGDFFSHLNGKDAEGAAAMQEFKGSTPATVSGPAESNGKVWATTQKARPTLLIDAGSRPAIDVVATPPPQATQAIAGSSVLVKDGKNVAPPNSASPFAKGPHPRTAVGIADGGKTLLLVVVDGRKKGEAAGMSLTDLADVMLKYGAESALNLDGGGSSVLAIRDPKTHRMQILNHPSDGRERVVANVLGVRVASRKPTTRPSQ